MIQSIKKLDGNPKRCEIFQTRIPESCKENNFNVMNIGVTPTPSRSKTQKGSMNINVKSKQKNPPPMGESIKPPTEEQKKFGALPQTPQLEGISKLKQLTIQLKALVKSLRPLSNIFSARTGC